LPVIAQAGVTNIILTTVKWARPTFFKIINEKNFQYKLFKTFKSKGKTPREACSLGKVDCNA
jgi:hypothetical protein